MADFDNECGFWIYNRPYVWIQGETKETSRRLYLLYNYDRIHIYTRRGYPFEGLPAFGMRERKPFFQTYYYIPKGVDLDYASVNMLDLWETPEKERMCSWAARYFGVYVRERDEDLGKLEVRRNGEAFRPPRGSRPGVVSYLKAAGFHKPGGVNFIKPPNWLRTIQ